MDPIVVGLLGMAVFLIILFAGVPVAFSMLFTGIVGIAVLRSPEAAFQIAGGDILSTFSSYTTSVAPLFALMGFIASYSGVGTGLFTMTDKFIGHRRGGLALATQAASGLFGAICGSIPATIVTIGSVAYPEMKRYKYDDSLATASVAAGATIAVLIPPSLWFIIYGTATENSVGRLFLAGVPAGILMMLLYMAAIRFVVWRSPSFAPASAKASWGERFRSLFTGGMLEIILVFLLSMGGLFAGWFTPTEAGSVGAFGILVITVLEKKLSFGQLKKALNDGVRLAAMIYLLLAGATVYGRFFALSRIPSVLGTFVAGLHMPAWGILGIILLIYVVLGCVIDSLALILLTIPIFYPIVCGTLGYDPIWFGVIVVVIVGMGGITPPVGMNVFIMKGVAKDVPIGTIFKGIWPFLVASLAMAAILIAFPSIVTFLPDLLFGASH